MGKTTPVQKAAKPKRRARKKPIVYEPHGAVYSEKFGDGKIIRQQTTETYLIDFGGSARTLNIHEFVPVEVDIDSSTEESEPTLSEQDNGVSDYE